MTVLDLGRSSGFRAAYTLAYAPLLPALNEQWLQRSSFPVTAAGPRGILTLFPYPKSPLLSERMHNR
ncbi:hypothetical protein YTPLAS18_23080 [Nitrospira sp.]|nr:hypothetical protein YTPLAS18_23080 [Nitrospira sp.]